jgi:hypothetical protein
MWARVESTVAEGAKYLLTTPEYRGPVPPGYILLQQTTYNGYMSLRLVLKDNSAANLQKAAEYAKRARIFPLSQVNNPPRVTSTFTTKR